MQKTTAARKAKTYRPLKVGTRVISLTFVIGGQGTIEAKLERQHRYAVILRDRPDGKRNWNRDVTDFLRYELRRYS